MKNLLKAVVPLLFVLLIQSCTVSEPFNGRIMYSVKTVGLRGDVMATDSVVTFYNDSIYRQVRNSQMGPQHFLGFTQENYGVLLLNLGGQNFSIRIDSLSDEATYRITQGKERKKILGYKCRETLLYDLEGNLRMRVYTTKKMGPTIESPYDQLDGFPMQRVLFLPDGKEIMTAEKMDATAPDSTVFVLPEDAIPITFQELMEMLGNE